MFFQAALAQMTTATIEGRILFQDQKPAAGVTITALCQPTGIEYGTITDTNGIFHLQGLAIGGPYTIEASFVGCDPVKRDGIMLSLGKPGQFDATLRESAQNIAAVVKSVSLHEIRHAGAAATYTRSQIDLLPTVSRSLYDIARLSPHVQAQTSGGLSIAGANSRYNSFQIDGVVSNDIYGLTSSGTNGGLTGANPIPLDAIKEISVAAAPFDVRQGSFTGGQILAVTKSGTNQFEGTAYTYFNNQDFYGRHPQKLSSQSTQRYGATLSGAIIPSRLFFFVAGEYSKDKSPSSLYPGSDGCRLKTEDAQQIADRFEQLTGYDGGGYSKRNVGSYSGSLVARLDLRINRKHDLSLRYNFLDADKDEYSNSPSQFKFNGEGYASVSTSHSLVAELNSRPSEKFFNTLRIGYNRVWDSRDIAGPYPYVEISKMRDGESTAALIGTDAFSGLNGLTQNSISITDDFTAYLGDHTLTAGTHNEIFMADNLYVSYAFGGYTYSTLQDFLEDKASSYYKYIPIGDPTIHMRTAQFGVYVQDEWKPSALNGRFSLTYGLRVDVPVIFNSPKENPEFNASEIATRYGLDTSNKPSSKLMFSPRVSFRYELFRSAHELLTLRGGAGLFTGKVPFVWITNCYSNTGMTQDGYAIFNPAQIPAFGGEPTGATVSNPAINTISRSFSFPQTLRANLALDYSLRGWDFTLEALFSKNFNNLRIENLVAQDKGSKLYAVDVLHSTPENTTIFYDSSFKSKYSSVYYLHNDNRGYSYSVSLSAKKAFSCGVNLWAAYTFSHSYSVNDGISSQASSIWGKSYAPESNSNSLSFSVFDVPHKISASVSYTKRYAKYFGSTISLVYQAYSGSRYSYTYYKNSIDVNGDSYKGNTPLYVPTQEELAAMDFETEEQRAAFGDFISSDHYLRSRRGHYAQRNAKTAPMEHHLDLHLAQDFYFGAKTSRRLQLTLDVINFGNMLSSSWGKSYYIPDWKISPVEVYALKDDGAGNKTPQYRWLGARIPTNDLLSRWHMQLGVRVYF